MDNLQEAINKIEALKKQKEELLNRQSTEQDVETYQRIQNVVNMLQEVQNRASSIVDTARMASRTLLGGPELVSRDANTSTGLGGLVSNLMTGATSIADSGVAITKSVLSTTANVAENLTSNTASVGKALTNAALNTSVSAINTSKNVAGNLIGSTANLANTLTSGVSNTMSSLLGSSNKADATSKTNSTLGDNISSLIGGTASTASNLLSNTSQLASSLVGSTASTVSNLTGSTANLVGNLAQSTLNTASGLIGSTANSLASGISSIFGGKTGSSSSGIFNSATSTVGSIASSLGSSLGSVASSITNAAGSVASNLLNSASSVASNCLSTAANVGTSALNAAASVGSSMLSTAANVGKGLIDTVGEVASSVLGSGTGSAVGSLANFAGSALGTVADVAGNALSAGTQLASGVLGAATNVASGLVNTAAGLATGVVDAASGLVNSLLGNASDNANSATQAASQASASATQSGTNGSTEMNNGQAATTNPSTDTSTSSSSDSIVESAQTSNPASSSNNTESGTMSVASYKASSLGWKEIEWELPTGAIEKLMHDGDQQAFNPYGHQSGNWTVFSFRPSDAKKTYPQIAITPASFMALSSMDDMLDNIPFVVIKEYFFKNTASTMTDFVKQILSMVPQAKEAPKSDGKNDTADTSSQGAAGTKQASTSLLDEIKKKFLDIGYRDMVIDIPYLLYCGLRQKTYGNTYVFPYIVDEGGGTIINNASNENEWNKGTGLIESLKDLLNNVAQFSSALVSDAMGSQSRAANLFPAPSWNPEGEGDKASFNFPLMLINDNAVKARNNYMCVNTIIHNNRQMQKAVLRFPGALYELWLPTGQRHLMCTADLKLYPLGLNRQAPKNFFANAGVSGANFKIGSDKATEMETEHSDVEVIPDGYKLDCTFKSCLANNMNTSVFQYYIKMDSYDSYSSSKTGNSTSNDDIYSKLKQKLQTAIANKKANKTTTTTTTTTKDADSARDFTRAIVSIVDESPEAFDEATYNDKIGTLKSYFGDMAPDAKSAVVTIKKSQGVIRESESFLKQLYDAENNNLWYKSYPQEEYYTTLTADAKQELQKRYRDKFKSLRSIDEQINAEQEELQEINDTLAEDTELQSRQSNINLKMAKLNSVKLLQQQRDEISDELVQIDVDLVNQAFDETDQIVSVQKNYLTTRIFQQVWNEKIMNSYEKDKVQYMTSAEKKRYFEEKVRELEKYDTYGILNTEDWFFRVVVLDYIISEMKSLISLFKDCTYDDFETVYKIIRKLDLLNLDIAQIRDTTQAFDINQTNLFFLSDDDVKDFTSIDDMLNGNTLYQLFKSQRKIQFVKSDETSSSTESSPAAKDKELVVEQNTERDVTKRRALTKEIIVRFWGSETELTKAAYELANKSESGYTITMDDGTTISFDTIKDMKNQIIKLKLQGNNDDELRQLLGSFTAQITLIKNALVLQKQKDMYELASKVIKDKDGDANAKTMKD